MVDRLLQHCHDIGAPTLTNIRRTSDSVLFDFDGNLEQLLPLRMFSTLSVVLDESEHAWIDGFADALAELEQSTKSGAIGALSGPPAYRVDRIEGREPFMETISTKLGWENDPKAWDVNIAEHGPFLLADVGAMHRSRRYAKLRRIPASVNPLVGSLLVQLAKPEADDTVYDPFCGSGTLLTEVAAIGRGAGLLGTDISPTALEVARLNLSAVDTPHLLAQARAETLPLPEHSVDRIISNMPFGKRVGSHHANSRLYPRFLAELTRVLNPKGRAVLLTEDKRLFQQAVQETSGIRVIKEVQVTSGGLHPTAYTIEHTQKSRRTDHHRKRLSEG
ncbi:methyltransferase domain-containing protein [Streptomyces sp. GMY02]|uniref:methyltransferase domain-containing protein n=1 Tax=Streptomyces sp. GMY02 TaxID=1333528 RepID=UPI001C2CB0EE|nr:methyltransferase domain-containing protein [Streptomyces sp. GMY02]QXE33543.1 methyltransferase domain-containing protein [Streptomyces sp. GMY02]